MMSVSLGLTTRVKQDSRGSPLRGIGLGVARACRQVARLIENSASRHKYITRPDERAGWGIGVAVNWRQAASEMTPVMSRIGVVSVMRTCDRHSGRADRYGQYDNHEAGSENRVDFARHGCTPFSSSGSAPRLRIGPLLGSTACSESTARRDPGQSERDHQFHEVRHGRFSCSREEKSISASALDRSAAKGSTQFRTNPSGEIPGCISLRRNPIRACHFIERPIR